MDGVGNKIAVDDIFIIPKFSLLLQCAPQPILSPLTNDDGAIHFHFRQAQDIGHVIASLHRNHLPFKGDVSEGILHLREAFRDLGIVNLE